VGFLDQARAKSEQLLKQAQGKSDALIQEVEGKLEKQEVSAQR
jgi:hypothetical protein